MRSIKLLQKYTLLVILFRLLIITGRSVLDTKVSRGNVATRFRCSGIFNHLYCKFTTESASERILKIGHHLAKLWARVRCPVFLLMAYYVSKNYIFYGQTLLFMSEIMQRLALASFKPEK